MCDTVTFLPCDSSMHVTTDVADSKEMTHAVRADDLSAYYPLGVSDTHVQMRSIPRDRVGERQDLDRRGQLTRGCLRSQAQPCCPQAAYAAHDARVNR